MVNDPIADMLTRIKNAYLARHQVVRVPYSRIKNEIARLLVDEGYLKNSRVEEIKKTLKKIITCELSYKKNGQSSLGDVRRISKPGRRVYARVDKLPKTLGGLGITIISTPKGVMTDKEARKKKLGGEIICQVW
jgi:small subunit ribosomal protein S8